MTRLSAAAANLAGHVDNRLIRHSEAFRPVPGHLLIEFRRVVLCLRAVVPLCQQSCSTYAPFAGPASDVFTPSVGLNSGPGPMRPFAAAAFMLLGLSLATTVQAGTLSFDSIVGNWTGATGGAALGGLNSSQLRWGNPITSHGQSGYDFDAAGPFTAATGTDFSLGEFTHLNRTIASGGSISAAVLSISYAFRLSDDPGTVINRSFDVDFAHLETYNFAATCADGAANGVGVNGSGCADRVTMGALSDIADTFTIGNIVYKLSLKGFEPGGTFWTEENKTSTSRLMGHFSATTEQTGGGGPSPVPLPASGLLLLAALGGLAWRRS